MTKRKLPLASDGPILCPFAKYSRVRDEPIILSSLIHFFEEGEGLRLVEDAFQTTHHKSKGGKEQGEGGGRMGEDRSGGGSGGGPILEALSWK